MVQLRSGQSLRFDCRFNHQGGPYSGAKLHAAIGNKGITFDEILNKESPSLSFSQYDATPTPYSEVVVIGPITVGSGGGKISAGRYEAYVKLMSIPGSDLFWYGPLDDIEVLSVEAVFSNLQVTYTSA